jgi:hypothetical protein
MQQHQITATSPICPLTVLEIHGDEWLATDYRKVPDLIQEQTLYQED